MKRSGILVLITVVLNSCTELRRLSGTGQEPYPVPEISGNIARTPVDEGLLHHADQLQVKRYWTEEVGRFYNRRDFRPAWTQAGVPTDAAIHLYNEIGEAIYNGLVPDDYQYQQIGFMTRELMDAGKIKKTLLFSEYANYDLLLTHSYLSYASDLLTGKVNPGQLQVIWQAHPRSKDLAGYLENALENDRLGESLRELDPPMEQYKRIKAELKESLDVLHGEGWKVPGWLPLLHTGDTGVYVETVRKFMVVTGDLSPVYEDGESSHIFDESLERAVRNFQYRHGLEDDGVIGENTLAAMNRSLEWRINRLRINMERLRWLPEDFGSHYLVVNLPEFKLRYYENGALAEEMKVIIGTEENLTPILVDTLVYIEFNPTWIIPSSIATEEMLPGLKMDPHYLRKRNIYILDASDGNRRVRPDSIDWNEVTEEEFPFVFVQKPGPWNALGQLKFIFPNNLAIYLHDTPADHLFQADRRTFSYGCVRVERPVDLAETLLEKFNDISRDSILDIMSDTVPHRVYIEGTVPVYFTYQTSWVDRLGNVNYREDIYAIDSAQLKMDDAYHMPEALR